MTLRVNPEFAAVLSAATTSNTAWSNAFKNGLGNTRRVICKIAPVGTAQANAYANGTKFRDAALTGTVVVEGGVVTKYGFTSGVTTALAADLAAGVAVLRIEGNSNWIEGTLGLVGSNADFVVPSNPTTTNSIAVTPNLRIKPPPFLPSGTGYAPPALSSEAPSYVVIEDWRDPSNIREAGRIHFNNRLENWVFTDAEVAAGMGDVRVTNSTEKVVFGDIEFGAILFSMNASANSSSGRSLHQVLVGQKPTGGADGSWPNYPRESGYRTGTRTFDAAVSYGISNTYAPPFKAKLYRADGVLLHTWDMPRDNLPINSDDLSDFPTISKPMRLHMNCAQMLFWQSNTPKMSVKSKKWFPGFDTRNLRPSMHKEKAAYAGSYAAYSIFSVSIGVHALEHWFAHGKYANALNVDAVRADPSFDPYLFDINPNNSTDSKASTPEWASVHGLPASQFGSLSYGVARLIGLCYEPGNFGGHNHITGPGGVRPDRGCMAGPTMIALGAPDFVHLRSNASIQELHEHWKLNYFNHSCHWIDGDIRDFKTIPADEAVQGKWSVGRAYYGSNRSYTAGGVDFAVPMFAVGASPTNRNSRPHGGAFTDANYRMPWGGYAVDWLHDYTSPADIALHYNSPAHAYSAKHRYMLSTMCALTEVSLNTSASKYLGFRQHAWRLLQAARMWKLASDHPNLGITRTSIEARVLKELENVYQQGYIPMWIENRQDTETQALKRFGVPIHFSSTSGKWVADSFGLTFYMAGTLAFMRQTGFFKRLWNMGEVPQKALLTIIRILDAGSIQWFTQTRGSYMSSALPDAQRVFGGGPYIPLDHTTAVNPRLAANWGEWRDTKYPLQGNEDWIHNADGTFNAPDSSEQLRAQWPSIRLNYFPDVECQYAWTEVQQAASIVADFHKQWDDKVKKNIADGVPVGSLKSREWGVPIPYALISPPNPADWEAL